MKVFIDDNMTLAVDLPRSDNMLRAARAALLAIHAVAGPLHENVPIPRDWMEALTKLAAEAAQEEIKLALGWLLNLRRLLVSLPSNKADCWARDVQTMLDRGTTTAAEIGTAIGRFVHFLGRLRGLEARAKKRHRSKITEKCREDLELVKTFINAARNGVDMNLLTYRLPNWGHRGDSCPFGMGGYNHLMIAWRWYIPAHIQNRATNNLLEHLATIVGVWVDIKAGRLKKGDCALSMGDSTTSSGWLVKSNWNDDPELTDSETANPIQEEIRLEVSCHHAKMMLENEICEYSQW